MLECARRGEFHGVIFYMSYINASIRFTQRLMIVAYILKQAKANKFAAQSYCGNVSSLELTDKKHASSNQLADSFFAPLNYA